MFCGSVTQFGQSGWLLTSKSRVQIPPGPLHFDTVQGRAPVSVRRFPCGARLQFRRNKHTVVAGAIMARVCGELSLKSTYKYTN